MQRTPTPQNVFPALQDITSKVQTSLLPKSQTIVKSQSNFTTMTRNTQSVPAGIKRITKVSLEQSGRGKKKQERCRFFNPPVNNREEENRSPSHPIVNTQKNPVKVVKQPFNPTCPSFKMMTMEIFNSTKETFPHQSSVPENIQTEIKDIVLTMRHN